MQNRIIGIVGAPGDGKTTLAADMFAACARAAVFNTANDEAYYAGADFVSDDIIEITRNMSKEKFRSVLDSADNVHEIKKSGQVALAYDDLDTFIQSCYETGNLTMFLDEAHDLCTRTSATYWLVFATRRGRHKGLNIVWISQRFQTVHTELTGKAHEYYLGSGIKEPLDMQGIKERCGAGTVEAIRNAGPHEFIHWTQENGLETRQLFAGRKKE